MLGRWMSARRVWCPTLPVKQGRQVASLQRIDEPVAKFANMGLGVAILRIPNDLAKVVREATGGQNQHAASGGDCNCWPNR